MDGVSIDGMGVAPTFGNSIRGISIFRFGPSGTFKRGRDGVDKSGVGIVGTLGGVTDTGVTPVDMSALPALGIDGVGVAGAGVTGAGSGAGTEIDPLLPEAPDEPLEPLAPPEPR